jgi:phage terminase large subunit-like protein
MSLPYFTKSMAELPYFTKAMHALPILTKSLIASGARTLTRAQARAVIQDFARLTSEQRRMVLRAFPAAMIRALAEEWWWGVHGGQHEPETAPGGEPWRVWAIVAGRGFGKTRAGAEWVWARAREDKAARIALVGATVDEVERVMVHGESGLLAIARGHERPRWFASRGILLFPTGAQAHVFSAERPDKLRGPQHHYAWCDELAKWPNAGSTWDNLMLGLRLGARPRTIVTTTPKPVPLLKRILALPRCAPTHGRTDENPHLPRAARSSKASSWRNSKAPSGPAR